MATTRAYWNNLRLVRDQIALRLGADMNRTSIEIRVASDATLATVAILAKALVDRGVLSDGQLQTLANNALDVDGSIWDPEPFEPLEGS